MEFEDWIPDDLLDDINLDIDSSSPKQQALSGGNGQGLSFALDFFFFSVVDC